MKKRIAVWLGGRRTGRPGERPVRYITIQTKEHDMTADHITECRPVGPLTTPAAHRAVCSCGWEGALHYSADHLSRACADAGAHVEAAMEEGESVHVGAFVPRRSRRSDDAPRVRDDEGDDLDAGVTLGPVMGAEEYIGTVVCSCEVADVGNGETGPMMRIMEADVHCPRHGVVADPGSWACAPGDLELEPGGETLDDYRRRQAGFARVGLLLSLALVCLAALAAPAAFAKAPTYREAEIAAKITNTIPGVLRAKCVTESNSLCVNATLWKERTAVLILFASVDAGTSPMCAGFREHSAAAARYVVALAASYKAPRSAVTAMGALHARRAWIAAYRRLAKCESFRWAS